MNATNSEQLVKQFPLVFARPVPNHCFTLFGFECADGWCQLLADCCNEIEAHLSTHRELQSNFSVAQIKEKFGGLRFYFYGGDDAIEDIIHAAEIRSETICEICGAPGENVSHHGWYITECPTCCSEPGCHRGE